MDVAWVTQWDGAPIVHGSVDWLVSRLWRNW